MTSVQRGILHFTYTYICICIYIYLCHFSRFCVADSPKKRFPLALHVRKALPKLNVSRSLEKYPASSSPQSCLKQLKKAAQISAASPSADERRRLFFEMKKASSEALAEEMRQALIRQVHKIYQVLHKYSPLNTSLS